MALKSVSIPKSPLHTVTVPPLEKLSEIERAEFEAMNIPIEDMDSIYSTPHGLVVETGRKRWMKARFGTNCATDEDIQLAKKKYNSILGKVRRFEKTMTSSPSDLAKHRLLMGKLARIYETIVKYGYEITREETRHGFDKGR